MTEESVLVFPGGMPAALAFSDQAQRAGKRVVGASSLQHDPGRSKYKEWAQLPWVLDARFDDAFSECVSARAVREIYTPHPIVWEHLHALLGSLRQTVFLHPMDWDRDIAGYERYREMAGEFQRQPWQTFVGEPKARMPLAHLAGLLRLFDLTPGQSDHIKLSAIVSLFRDLPAGDIVEIGTLFGRTALALAFLARHYETGKVLCVDPWCSSELVQDTEAVDKHSEKVPIEKIFEAFTANLAPWADTVNYVRQPSAQAVMAYSASPIIQSPEFGSTVYRRRISLLHIDGNHRYDAVVKDVAHWARFVQPGGWILFDDYRWPFGDGPRRAADEFCQDQSRWTTAFEAGGALFVRQGEK